MPKSSKRTRRVAVDQDVRRLQIPMHDQIPVRIGDRRTDIEEEADDGPGIERSFAAPGVDTFALDQRHRQPGSAIIEHAGIEQSDDIRVIEAGQDRLFAQKAFATVAGQGAHRQEFERCDLGGFANRAFRAVDNGHSAAADFLDDIPVADACRRRLGTNECTIENAGISM